MTHENGRSPLGFLKGLLFGGAVGVTLGVLLSPQSGQDTRSLIQHKSNQLRDRLTHTAATTRAQAERLADEARAEAVTLQQSSREYLQSQKERIEKTAEAAKRAVKETWNDSAKTPSVVG